MVVAFLATAALLFVGPAATALATTSQAALIITNSLRTKTVGSTVTLTTYGHRWRYLRGHRDHGVRMQHHG